MRRIGLSLAVLLAGLAVAAGPGCSDSNDDSDGGSGGGGGTDGGDGGGAGTDGGGAGGGGGTDGGGTDGGGNDGGAVPKDPDKAPKASIDRFSPEAGTLMVRDGKNGLPEANAPIDMDQPPFITQGLGPKGGPVRYYNFDVQSTTPAPIWALFREGEPTPVAGQLNIVDVIPGDDGYNDFWLVHKVTVPKDYVANTVTSKAEVVAAGFKVEPTDMLVDCRIGPEGSTATQRGGSEPTSLHRGWYRGMVVSYFTFEEKSLAAEMGMVPISPIYVTFNKNPSDSDPTSGPASGFVTEPPPPSGLPQTHNVPATLPADADYSPLWSVVVYDNADFASVEDLPTAMAANILATGVATVNCPIVSK